jgi:hypothetical protein
LQLKNILARKVRKDKWAYTVALQTLLRRVIF